MKIAFIVHDYRKTGGHARYVVELATRFAREHEVHVFASLVEGDRDPRIRFHYVPSIRVTALASILSFILPATMLKLGNCDIVHAQGLCGLRQDIVTAHICLAAWFEAQRLQMGALTLKQRIFRFLVQPFEKYIFDSNRSREVIAVSNRVKTDLKRCYQRDRNVTVIYHGVDTLAFHPDNRARWRASVRAEMGFEETDFILLYVGDLQKGARPALDAAAKVEEVNLVFVSASDPAEYRTLAVSAGIESRVRFQPKSAAIQRYYAAADVFVLTSFYDTFGLVAAEAMATGLPVIVSSAAGISELIEDGVSGFLVDPPWNSTAVARSLKQLKNDALLRERMGRAARARIEKYTWDATAAETLKVYEKVLEEKRAHSNGRA